MNLKMEFRVERHPKFDNLGLVPLWMPDHQDDPLTGMGVAHDVLEHGPNDVCEWQGLGGSLFVRGREYYVRRPYNPDYAAIVGSEWFNLYHLWEGQDIPDPGRTKPLEESVEEMIQSCLVAGRKACQEEDEPRAVRWVNANNDRMRGWLRKGYRAAARRWKAYDQYMMLETFCAIEQRVDDMLKNAYEGQDATLVFNPSYAEARIIMEDTEDW